MRTLAGARNGRISNLLLIRSQTSSGVLLKPFSDQGQCVKGLLTIVIVATALLCLYNMDIVCIAMTGRKRGQGDTERKEVTCNHCELVAPYRVG